MKDKKIHNRTHNVLCCFFFAKAQNVEIESAWHLEWQGLTLVVHDHKDIHSPQNSFIGLYAEFNLVANPGVEIALHKWISQMFKQKFWMNSFDAKRLISGVR